MSRRWPIIVAIPALVLCGGTAASASTTSTTSTPAAGRSCVATAIPVGSGETPKITCYATFAGAVLAVTNGRVRLPATARPGSVTPDELNQAPDTPDATFVLSVDYQNSNLGGNTLFWTETSACGNFEASSMPSGWNDEVSSVAASSGCATTLFQNNSFAGTTFVIKKNATILTLGSFNDEASSQIWCTAAPCTP
jgi:hypothetical protein